MLFGRIVAPSCTLAAGALLWGCSAQKMPSPPVTGTVIPGAVAAQGTGGAGSTPVGTSAATTGLAPGQQPVVAPDAGGAPQMNGLAGVGGGPVDMGEPPDDESPLADGGATGPGDAAVPPVDAGSPADAGGFGGFGGEPGDDGP
jgi:hypothetical protein